MQINNLCSDIIKSSKNHYLIILIYSLPPHIEHLHPLGNEPLCCAKLTLPSCLNKRFAKKLTAIVCFCIISNNCVSD